MRLIDLLVFFFTFYGNTFARAEMTLDLDNYDPELVKLNVQNFNSYALENFSAAVGDGFTAVVDSGSPLWYQNDVSSTLVERVLVYTVKSVPQLVQLHFVPGGQYLYFRKNGDQFEVVDYSKFVSFKESLHNGTYLTNKQYALNLKNNNNNRQFYTRKASVVDGVSTLTFTPNNLELKLTTVNDGLLPVYTPDHKHLVTSVTASLKHGEPAAVAVEMLADGYNVTSFFKKVNNTWEEVNKDVYKRVLHTLAPEYVFDVLTLDLSDPTEEKFQVVKVFEPGVMRADYTPMPTFHVSKVVNAGVPLWSSHDFTATKVLTFTAHNVLKLVKVSTKSPEGVEEDVNLERVPGGFAPLNDQAFSVRVNKLLQEGQESRQRELPPDDETVTPEEQQPVEEQEPEQEPFPEEKEKPRQEEQELPFHPPVNVPVKAELDVLAPNEQYFKVKHGTVRGVPVKMFFANNNVNVTSVQVGTHEVWKPENGSRFVSSYLYYLNREPKVVEVRVVEHDGEKVYNRLELEDGQWSTQLPSYFDQFLSRAVSAPKPGHSLTLDLDKDDNPHTTEEHSERFGVKSTSFHAEEGYHYYKVYLGDQLLWYVPHNKAYLVKATGYSNKYDETDKVVLVELEGFLNGEYKNYYFSLEDGKWVSADKKHFDVKFLSLKKPPTQPQEQEPEQEPLPEEQEKPRPGDEFTPVPLDTNDVDDEKVDVLKARASEGYYFSSYTPKGKLMFSDVTGPEDFHFESRSGKFVTFVKFYYVHQRLVGARLDTVTSKELTHPLTYYYTYKNKEWTYTVSDKQLLAALTTELTFTESQKKELENALKADEQFKKAMEKVEQARRKEEEKQRKQKEKEEEVKVPDKLSHKRKLYEDMVDFEQQQTPKKPEPVEETEEELEARKQDYASEKLLVESELVYLELNNPESNRFVHTKDYSTFGLKALDVTPVVGKWVHVVAMHGKRVWVSSSNKRCTNLQMFYEDGQVVGAVLRVTTAKYGKLKTGEDFDYLFLLEGELKKVSDRDFVTLANRRFQRSTLANLAKFEEGLK